VIHSALALAGRGFYIFPCRPRDKRPATANGLKDAITDPEIIRAWWRQHPDNNIAIATGPASGIFVVDVDGLDAEATLRRFEAEYGALPATVEVITARGRHVYFKWPQESVRCLSPATINRASALCRRAATGSSCGNLAKKNQ
jgi:hypothetical protein